MPREASIADILRIFEVFPRFVEAKEATTLNEPVMLREVEVALKCFKRDKSLGPDGWPMEFYIKFLDIIGLGLLLAIEDCRLSVWMYEGFNSTFLTLIKS